MTASFNSCLASSDFHHLLITSANSLDPDQDRQNVGPDLDPNCLTLKECSGKNFLKKTKVCRQSTNYPACKELKVVHCILHKREEMMLPYKLVIQVD